MNKKKLLVISSILGILVFACYALGMTVFDPKNYSANIVTKANSIKQAAYQVEMVAKQTQMVLNQIQQLKNDATNLLQLNVALTNPFYNSVENINSQIRQIKGIGYSATGLPDKYYNIFSDISFAAQPKSPSQIDQVLLNQKMAVREEIFNAMYSQSALITESNNGIKELNAIMVKSRAAQGNLEATQACNELLAQLISQNIKTQQMIAINSRMLAAQNAQMQGIEYSALEKHKWSMENYNKPSTVSPKPIWEN